METTKRSNQKTPIFLLVNFLVFATIGCITEPPENSRAAQAIRGKAHFEKYCIGCHGMDGKGLAIDSLQTQPADLTRITASRRLKSFPVQEIALVIDGRDFVRHHKTRDMPIWGEEFKMEGNLDEHQLRGKLGEIIAYLMSIQGS